MKVILYDDVEKLGSAGDVKEVAAGFARNFLIPKKLAMAASDANVKRWESEKRVRTIRLTQNLERAKESAQKIESVSLVIPAKAGREGHLFGSVTNQMIAEALLAQGLSIDKKNIVLDAPIKQIGDFTAHVRLHAQVNAALKVSVVPSAEGSQSVPAPAAATNS